jgi:hypothetical protein
MTTKDSEATPVCGSAHDALSVLIGEWRAEGDSFAARQTIQNPRGTTEKWLSDETFEWLPGQFFVMKRWNAMTGANPFQGIAIVNWDDTRLVDKRERMKTCAR